MDLNKRNKVYKMALDKWGQRAQLEMLQEETTELALAARNYIRKNDDASFSNLIEEIADVEIMIEQVSVMHGDLNIRQLIDEQKIYKVNRLLKRLDKSSFEALESEDKFKK